MSEENKMENVYERIYRGLILFNSVLFAMFFIENINTLDEIQLELPFDTGETTINFYSFITTIIAIFGIAILASVSIFGAGLNATGSSLIGKMISMLVLYSILSLATLYYFGRLFWIGDVFAIISIMIYGFKGLSIIGGGI